MVYRDQVKENNRAQEGGAEVIRGRLLVINDKKIHIKLAIVYKLIKSGMEGRVQI